MNHNGLGYYSLGIKNNQTEQKMNTAIENLQSRDPNQRANVIEALESISAKWRDILQPLMRLWEEESMSVEAIDWNRLLSGECTSRLPNLVAWIFMVAIEMKDTFVRYISRQNKYS